VNCEIEYFKEWLSGFIEAKSSFCIRQNGHHSFSICRSFNDDIYFEHFIQYICNYLLLGPQLNVSFKVLKGPLSGPLGP
jgi:hypothetical protein